MNTIEKAVHDIRAILRAFSILQVIDILTQVDGMLDLRIFKEKNKDAR